MSRLIAIIAPIFLENKFDTDFRILLDNSNKELNLQFLYNFIKNNYIITEEQEEYNSAESMMPAAGYYLSSTLRRAGYNTILTQFHDDLTLQEIADQNPIAVCLSTTMIFRKSTCFKIIKQIKKIMPGIKIIIGGVFAWKSLLAYNLPKPKEYSNDWELFTHSEDVYNDCYFITSPHGITSLFLILKEIEKGKKADFNSIPNLIFLLHQNLYFTQFTKEIIDINEDYTHWELFDILPQRFPIRTSIGCPYSCTYCDFHKLYPQLLIRNTESIKNEILTIKKLTESQHKMGIIYFTDDNVSITNKRLKEICNVMIESKIELPWMGFMRASAIHETDIELLKKSNLIMAMMGIESGSQEILQGMKKHHNLQQVKSIIELLDEYRITIGLSFLIGFPEENNISIEKTAQFLNDLNSKNDFIGYQLYPLNIMPLSELTDPENRSRWEIEGLYDNWKHSTMDSGQAKEESYSLFKKIDSIPYYYYKESNFFNYRFNPQQRKKLIKLRKDLTMAVFEKKSYTKIHSILISISSVMGLHTHPPNQNIIERLIVPG